MSDYVPPIKTKNNTFSVRMKDREHEALLKVSAAEEKYRAVTMVDLAKLGLEVYAQRLIEKGEELSAHQRAALDAIKKAI